MPARERLHKPRAFPVSQAASLTGLAVRARITTTSPAC